MQRVVAGNEPILARPRVACSLRVELVDEPVQPLGVNVQVDDCGTEFTQHTAHVPPVGPRLGEVLQQHHDACAFLAQLRELDLDQLDPMRLCRTSGRLHSLLPETLARRVMFSRNALISASRCRTAPSFGFGLTCSLWIFSRCSWTRCASRRILLRSSFFPTQVHLAAV